MGSVGEGCSLEHLIQQLLLHLCDGINVQHFGRQWLVFIHSSTLHQHIQSLQENI